MKVLLVAHYYSLTYFKFGGVICFFWNTCQKSQVINIVDSIYTVYKVYGGLPLVEKVTKSDAIIIELEEINIVRQITGSLPKNRKY